MLVHNKHLLFNGHSMNIKNNLPVMLTYNLYTSEEQPAPRK